jgi:hypothetical protein
MEVSDNRTVARTIGTTIRRETVNNVNTQTALVSRPPTEFLPNHPPPT